MAMENEKDNELFEEQQEVAVDTSDKQDLLDEVLEELSGNEKSPKSTPKKEKKPFDTRRLKAGSMAMGLTVIVVVAVFLFNLVVGLVEKRFPLIVDTTAQQLYTLTDEFKDFASGIDKETTVTVCLPETDLTNPQIGVEAFDNTYKQLHSALEHLNRLSDGKVTVKYLDLSADPTAATEMAKLNATEGSILFTCGSLSRVTSLTEDYTNYGMQELYNYYYSYGSMPEIRSMVEHTLAVNLHAVTADKSTTATLLIGHKEEASTISLLTALFKQQGYAVEQVDITTAATFAADSRLAVIAAPNEDYTDDEITALRTWLANGDNYERHLLYFPVTTCATPKLDTFVADTYGITVTNAVSIQENPTNRPQNTGSYALYFSYAETQATAFTEGGARVRTALNRILQKSDKAVGTVSPLYLFPEGTKQQDVLSETAEAVATADKNAAGAMLAKNTVNGHDSYAMVFGSATYLQFFDSDPENEDLILQVVNGVLDNKEALNLPGRAVTGSNLFNVGSMSTAWVLFTLFVLILPLGTLAICLVVFIKRRHL